MAIESACNFDLLYVNDGYFPSFSSHQNELQDELLMASLDAQFAEELQVQEVLKASLITCQTPSNVSSTPAMTMEAVQGGNTMASLLVKEKGESSLSCCEICLEKKQNDQMLKNESPDTTLCIDCSKIIELSRKQSCCKELSLKVNCGNDSGKPFTDNPSNNSSQKAKTNQFSHSAGNIVSLNSVKDDGKWNASDSKNENGAGSSAIKLQCPENPNPKPWEHKDVVQNSGLPSNADSKIGVGRGNGESQSSNGCCMKSSSGVENNVTVADESSDSDALNDTNEFNSDTSQKRPETCLKSILFEEFFERLEKLTIEEINEPARQWHCPACQEGPGSKRWYRGLQALMSHAKTKGKKTLKLHLDLVQLLEEKLRSKEASAVPAGTEAFGKWKGLKAEQNDHEIVWPPMVVIRNTSLKKDDNNKWIGMTNQELLGFFSSYDAIVGAQHAYNSQQGHCGMSILIFESSSRGYLEAERLHKHYAEQGIDRKAWDHQPVYFLPSGERQLYGYMAVKEDVDMFNQCSTGTPKLWYQMRSYQEMVVNRIRHMDENNRHLIRLKNRVAQLQRHEKVVEQNRKERLDKALKELDVLRQKIKLHHEQSQEEMDFQEQFFQDQMKVALEARDGKEDDFDNALQEEEGNENPSNPQDYKYKVEETGKPMMNEEEEVEAERNKKWVQGIGGGSLFQPWQWK